MPSFTPRSLGTATDYSWRRQLLIQGENHDPVIRVVRHQNGSLWVGGDSVRFFHCPTQFFRTAIPIDCHGLVIGGVLIMLYAIVRCLSSDVSHSQSGEGSRCSQPSPSTAPRRKSRQPDPKFRFSPQRFFPYNSKNARLDGGWEIVTIRPSDRYDAVMWGSVRAAW